VPHGPVVHRVDRAGGDRGGGLRFRAGMISSAACRSARRLPHAGRFSAPAPVPDVSSSHPSRYCTAVTASAQLRHPLWEDSSHREGQRAERTGSGSGSGDGGRFPRDSHRSVARCPGASRVAARLRYGRPAASASRIAELSAAPTTRHTDPLGIRVLQTEHSRCRAHSALRP
jgi:hypothetical protein